MKKIVTICIVMTMILTFSGVARSDIVTFKFDPDDLIQLYPASAGMSDVEGQNKVTQPNARRIHQPWATNWYETFYNPADPKPQPNSYNTYMNWRDSLGAGEGISRFNTWLLDNPNARSWGETIVSRLDAPPGAATAADGWTAEILNNPWGAGYLIEWSTDDPTKYINATSNIGEFSFTVDAYLDVDADGWDEDDPGVVLGETYRIWFGAANWTESDGEGGWTQEWSVHFDDQGWGSRTCDYGPWSAGLIDTEGYGSGYEGILDIVAVPLPGAVLLGILGLGVAGVKLRKFV